MKQEEIRTGDDAARFLLELLAVRYELHQKALHKHKHCGVVWEHRANDFDSQEAYDEGHKCPKCGEKQMVRWHESAN